VHVCCCNHPAHSFVRADNCLRVYEVFELVPSATVAINPIDSLVGTNLKNCSSLVRRSTQSQNTLTCYTNKTFATNAANSMGIYVKLFSNLNQFMLFYIDLTPYAQAQAQAKKNAKFN